jgi:acyl carrier protein
MPRAESLALRHDDCQYAEYEAWFEDECNKLSLEPGFSVVGPFVDPCAFPDSPPWNSDFAIIYPDRMYVRVGEYYRQLPKTEGGGGCRQYFKFHYGPCTGDRDEDGFPIFNKEFELRIDIDCFHGRHAHYVKEDHIPEDRLPGLDFDSMDPFKFILAVEEHRKISIPLHEILGFEVVLEK